MILSLAKYILYDFGIKIQTKHSQCQLFFIFQRSKFNLLPSKSSEKIKTFLFSETLNNSIIINKFMLNINLIPISRKISFP
jgi:hypothetical protein